MPKDVNQHGTVFGGVILSWIDQSAFLKAREHGDHRWVTARFESVNFVAPVHVGDSVSFYAWSEKVGTKSVTIGIDVEVIRYDTKKIEKVTTAQVVMVSVDRDGKSIPFSTPPTIDGNYLSRGCP